MGEFQKGKHYVHTTELYDKHTLGLGFVKKNEKDDGNFVRVLPFGWIEQAKKEFPKIPENTPQKSDAQWIIELTGFRIQMREWREKWFGK